jgi:transcriptional regulator GlxA family with amidase domain
VSSIASEDESSRYASICNCSSATAMSPIQYQKRLRLQEARRLLLSAAPSAEAVAYEVGYASASQFSREYARLFGQPPRRDAERTRA